MLSKPLSAILTFRWWRNPYCFPILFRRTFGREQRVTGRIPITLRIKYKCLIKTYNTIQGLAPTYLLASSLPHPTPWRLIGSCGLVSIPQTYHARLLGHLLLLLPGMFFTQISTVWFPLSFRSQYNHHFLRPSLSAQICMTSSTLSSLSHL